MDLAALAAKVVTGPAALAAKVATGPPHLHLRSVALRT